MQFEPVHNSTAIEDMITTGPKVLVYPNPAFETISIFSLIGSNEVVLFDLMGTQLISETTNEKQLNINTSDLPKGVYLLKISNGINRSTKKIVIH